MAIERQEKQQFHCQQCGACCRWEGHVLLTDEDVSRLADTLEISEEEFIDRHTILAANRRQLSLAEHPDGRCIFLEGPRCRHYAARPAQCRNFPDGWHDTSGCPALDKTDDV